MLRTKVVYNGIRGGGSHPLSNIILYSAGSPGFTGLCRVFASWVGSSVGGHVSWGGDVRLTRVLASTLINILNI